MTDTRQLVQDRRAEYAFHDDLVYLHEAKRGLTRATVEEISAIKNEPDWMLQYRLRSYEHFLKRPMPTWTDGLDKIDFDRIVYYRKPSEREEKNWDDVGKLMWMLLPPALLLMFGSVVAWTIQGFRP